MDDYVTLALAYAPKGKRLALQTLWALDFALGRIVATTTEPLIGQMRLTWWHNRLVALDAGSVPAEPILGQLSHLVRECDITGAELAILVEGWEILLEPLPLSDDQLLAFAGSRGNQMFVLSARILGSAIPTGLGTGWALTDFAARCSDRVTRDRTIGLFRSMRIAGPKPLRVLANIARARSRLSTDQVMKPVSRWTILRAVLS